MVCQQHTHSTIKKELLINTFINSSETFLIISKLFSISFSDCHHLPDDKR